MLNINEKSSVESFRYRVGLMQEWFNGIIKTCII